MVALVRKTFKEKCAPSPGEASGVFRALKQKDQPHLEGKMAPDIAYGIIIGMAIGISATWVFLKARGEDEG